MPLLIVKCGPSCLSMIIYITELTFEMHEARKDSWETDSPNATEVYYVCLLTFINFFAREVTMLSIGNQS